MRPGSLIEGMFAILVLAACAPETGLWGASDRGRTVSNVRPHPDSLALHGEAMGIMRGHYRALGFQDETFPGRSDLGPSVEDAREARLDAVTALARAAVEIPGDGWVLAHRVGLEVLLGRFDRALEMVNPCLSLEW
jgi:hypothetical protein